MRASTGFVSCVGINLLAKMLVVCKIINIKRTLYSCHQCNKLHSKVMLRELWRKSCGCWRYLQQADPANIGKETMNLRSLTKKWHVYVPMVVKLYLIQISIQICTSLGSADTPKKLKKVSKMGFPLEPRYAGMCTFSTKKLRH